MSSLDFRNVSYSVTVGGKKNAVTKNILTNLNGVIQGGELVALIGTSGVGKTTLLNVLAGRIEGGNLSGIVRFNGKKRNKKTFKRGVAYVVQDDLLFPTLTTRETIEFAADFRLSDKDFDPQQKSDRIDDVLKSLRLAKSSDTFIGSETMKGLSGGERKRVCIGVEIVTEPHLLLLDEPTSGLDSNSSEVIVNLVKEIAVNKNIPVISSIHQPSSKIFYTFDKVILMVPESIVYFGSTEDVLDYFSLMGYECPPNENPADFLVDVLTIDTEDTENLQESLARAENLRKNWSDYVSKNGPIYLGNNGSENSLVSKGEQMELEYGELDDSPVSAKNSWFKEFNTLAKRASIRQSRDPGTLITMVGATVFIALLYGFTFFRRTKGFQAVQGRLGVLLLMATQNVFPVTLPVIPVLIQERAIMTRERNVGSYRMSAFFAAISFQFIPATLVFNIIQLTAVYFLARLQTNARKFFIYIAVYITTMLNSLGVAFVTAASTSSVRGAAVWAPLFLTLYFVYNGTLLNSKAITPGLSWIRYIDYIYYTVMALLQNEMDGLVFECPADKSIACYPDGASVIAAYSLDAQTIAECIAINLATAVGYFALAYYIMRFRNKPKYIII
ncbi:ABC transporter G family member 22 [Smittium mucronatum]|uniref:ABC transporter G family member 22 n=1 Tax=Smittium mucronatum TaxID=133383 RepID=A0A1R0GUW1_9FUNG|nr:ABC transporter G family member 22 [Smittium mucronatum]